MVKNILRYVIEIRISITVRYCINNIAMFTVIYLENRGKSKGIIFCINTHIIRDSTRLKQKTPYAEQTNCRQTPSTVP
jgi:hypothetical protein